MKDLFLTPRGDLAIDNILNSHERLELNFITSKSNALVVNFFLEDGYENKPSASSLIINFNFEKPEFNKELKLISGDMCMEQAIKIRLQSALGSIEGNKDIGSKLEMVIHELIDNPSTLLNLERIIKEAIYDLIPNANISIEKTSTKYIDYSTNLKISIIDKDKKYNINI